jgi:putative sigma-54 modulation protein
MMDILIHADGFRMGDDLKAAVEEKIGRLDQYAPRAMRARVHLRRVASHHNDKEFQVKVQIEMPGPDATAEKSASQPLEALDLIAEILENQLRKRKDDRLSRREKDGLDDKATAISMA